MPSSAQRKRPTAHHEPTLAGQAALASFAATGEGILAVASPYFLESMAFRVARVPVPLTDILRKHDHLPTPRATIKALPTPHRPPSPLRIARPPVWFPSFG